jgi:hypothetical protein
MKKTEVKEGVNSRELAHVIDVTVTEINSGFKKSKKIRELVRQFEIDKQVIFDEIITDTCKKYNVSEDHVRTIMGLTKKNETI